jgi:hypothetical protein
VSGQPKLLFETDFDRFWKIVGTIDREARLATLPTIEDRLLCETIRLGVFNEQEIVTQTSSFYREVVLQTTGHQRLTVSKHVATFVQETSIVSANAFLPFIVYDPERSVVSTAVIDYASLGRPKENDSLSRVNDILEMFQSNILRNRGAAFGALLHIGDSRVCDLLIPWRDRLEKDELSEAVKCSTGIIHASIIDFYLTWLEQLLKIRRDGVFGIIASGLLNLKRRHQTDEVLTGQRPFPVLGVTPEQWKRYQKPVPFKEHLRHLARRMYALETAEPPPRVMPVVLAAWGLAPRTDPAETAKPEARDVGSGATSKGQVVDVKGEWWDGVGNIFLVWGILNPNGPTLYILGARKFDDQHRSFLRWFHMLGGETTYAADTRSQVTYESIYNDAEQIHKHLASNGGEGLFHVIPSFLIANRGDEALGDVAKRLLAEGAAAEANWGREMAYLRQFGSDFFGRTGAEIREYYESELAEAKRKREKPSDSLRFLEARYGHIPDFKDAKIPVWTTGPITPELLDEWWGRVSAKEYQLQGLMVLKTMWQGASGELPEQMKGNLLEWDPVIRFIDRYGFALSDPSSTV